MPNRQRNLAREHLLKAVEQVINEPKAAHDIGPRVLGMVKRAIQIERKKYKG